MVKALEVQLKVIIPLLSAFPFRENCCQRRKSGHVYSFIADSFYGVFYFLLLENSVRVLCILPCAQVRLATLCFRLSRLQLFCS